MTGNSSQQRKPYDTTPYASLRGADAGDDAPKAARPDERARDMAANEFAAEAEKLKALREALWAAFEAGPAAGLPNTLIDLTIAYTNALRLQLNLRSVSTRQLQHRPMATTKSDSSAKS